MSLIPESSPRILASPLGSPAPVSSLVVPAQPAPSQPWPGALANGAGLNGAGSAESKAKADVEAPVGSDLVASEAEHDLACLRELERKVLWLACWTVHNANHIRPKRDGLKVGGHQASSASVATLMTALYFGVLRPEDRVAVKPHASPIFHAIQYLYGRQSREKLESFRAIGGAQSYPSRTKDHDDVDFSTGSVGLGVAMTSFASIVQDYLRLKQRIPDNPGRMIAVLGDGELDEGNIFECLLEGWKHDLRNTWWVVDYNRQSLDSVVEDRLFQGIDGTFESMGWRVLTLKYGKLLEAAFARRGGDALRTWIDETPNSLYSTLVYRGGADWREHLLRDLGDTSGIRELLDEHDDPALHQLMTNLAGHDLPTILDAFQSVDDDRPTCFLAYTIKGYGLPFAGHKDNHAGLMNPEQMEQLRATMAIGEGREWEPFEGLSLPPEELKAYISGAPFAVETQRRHLASRIEVPASLPAPSGKSMSTQEAFGRLMNDLSRTEDALADAILTTSPDVTVSTNLGAWVNRRGLFDRRDRADVFKREHVLSTQQWAMSPSGQHVELGIAENNLFLLLAAAGLSHSVFGSRLLPVGTVYDPFISRGLDALNYACYQDARFLLVGTPSGISLAPEGGAHQSVISPLIGIGQPGLLSFEPAYADELAVLMRFAFEHMQADDGSAVYLRLSTRPLDQPERTMDAELEADILRGGYWLRPPAPGAELALVCSGPVTTEVLAAHEELLEDVPGAGVLMVTSADRLYRDWRAGTAATRREGAGKALSHAETLLAPLARDAALVTAIDAHPASLSWLGSVSRHRVTALGVEEFGQSGDIPDLYRRYGLDTEAVLDAAASALLGRL